MTTDTSKKLNGHIKISIHNPTTGDTKVVEKDNTVTNAVYDLLCNNFGGLGGSRGYGMQSLKAIFPIYEKLFGGILLYNSSLMDDHNYKTNYGIQAVPSAYAGRSEYPYGYGFNCTVDDCNLQHGCRGNPVLSDTIITSNSVKMVWEWDSMHTPTSSFDTICLCPAYIGDKGNYLDRTERIDRKGEGLLNPTTTLGFNPIFKYTEGTDVFHSSSNKIIMGYHNNTSYAFEIDKSGIMTLYVTPMYIDRPTSDNSGLNPITSLSETFTIDLGHPFISNNNCMFHFDYANNKLLIFSVYTDDDITNLTPKELTMDSIDLSTKESVTESANSSSYLWTLRYNQTDVTYKSYGAPIQAPIVGNILYYPNVSETNKPDEIVSFSQFLVPGLTPPPDISTLWPTVPSVSIFTYHGIANLLSDNRTSPSLIVCSLFGGVVTSSNIFAYMQGSIPSYKLNSYITRGPGLLFTPLRVEVCHDRSEAEWIVVDDSEYGTSHFDTYYDYNTYYTKLNDILYIASGISKGDAVWSHNSYTSFNNIIFNSMFLSTYCKLDDSIFKQYYETLRIEYTLTEV